ncbi:hypothetical protein [Gordonia alkanivorans]|uniref:hypothetical protein n=1 Tax=Gordonia alkanivorans TaxID=84096 RepID=UPI0024487783|nr:hypothetical protein [Gordonia alkanivorans]MDH3013905.1 hypothetical protein [Gordonia alkanivorans]
MTNSQPHGHSAQWAQVYDLLSRALAELNDGHSTPLRSSLQDVSELTQRIRELDTPKACDTPAAAALFDLFELDLLPSGEVLYEAACALRTLATVCDFDRVASIASNTTFGVSRSPLLAWLVDHSGSRGLEVVVDQLADPTVRAIGLRHLRRYHPTPTHLIGSIESFLDDPDPRVRTEAERTANLLYLAIFAPSLRTC